MTAFFSALIGLIKAIPIINGWVQGFITLYVNSAIDRMSAENIAAIKKAIEQHNQIDLEKAVGNPHAGEPSDLPGTVIRDKLPGVLMLSIVFFFSGCVTREEVKAYVWLNNGMPAEICAREPELLNYGFYRRLNDDKFEFISFCDERAKNWLGIYKADFEKMLDALLPEKRDDE